MSLVVLTEKLMHGGCTWGRVHRVPEGGSWLYCECVHHPEHAVYRERGGQTLMDVCVYMYIQLIRYAHAHTSLQTISRSLWRVDTATVILIVYSLMTRSDT